MGVGGRRAGDTWQHGIGSDVVKVADYMALTRARAACLEDVGCDSRVSQAAGLTRLDTDARHVRTTTGMSLASVAHPSPGTGVVEMRRRGPRGA